MEQVKAEPVADWLQECTDGRVSSHTITMLNSFRRWYDEYRPLYTNPQPAAVDGVVELVSDMMREVFISGADWGRTRPGHFSDYLADAIKPHLEALTKTKQP